MRFSIFSNKKETAETEKYTLKINSTGVWRFNKIKVNFFRANITVTINLALEVSNKSSEADQFLKNC